MSTLSQIDPKLRISYRSGRDDLVRDFYVPCLERAVLYRRAVADFSKMLKRLLHPSRMK